MDVSLKKLDRERTVPKFYKTHTMRYIDQVEIQTNEGKLIIKHDEKGLNILTDDFILKQQSINISDDGPLILFGDEDAKKS